MAASASHDRTVRLWDVLTGACSQVLEHASAVHNAQWLPAGHEGPDQGQTYLVTTLASGEMYVWLSDGRSIEPEPRLELKKWRRLVNCAHGHPGRIVMGLQDDSVRVVAIPSGETEQIMRGGDGWVQVVTLVGRHLVAGSACGQLTIWAVAAGSEAADTSPSQGIWNRYQPHADAISCLCCHGRHIATASDDATLCLAQFGPTVSPVEAAHELADMCIAAEVGLRLDTLALDGLTGYAHH